jgi:type IV secretion system protein VirD4
MNQGGKAVTAHPEAKRNKEVGSMKNQSPAQKIVVSGLYNTMLAASTRCGKGVSNVIPALLSYPDNVIVLDFKGENTDE